MQFVIAIVALLIGAAFCFGGWRFFLLLLPFWGLLVGFQVGVEAVQAIFGDGTFATVTSWLVGFGFALVFAVLSYLWWYAAIALLGGSVGFMIGSAAWGLIGNSDGLIAFLLGLALAVVFAIGILVLNVPRLLVIVVSGLGGAAAIVAAWFILTGQIPVDHITWMQIGALIRDSWFWLIAWGVIGAAGIIAQVMVPAIGPDKYELDQSSYRYS